MTMPIKAQLQKFTMDARRTPKRVLLAHAADEITYLGIVTLSGVGRKSSHPSFFYAAVAALSHTPNASARRLLNRVRFSR